MAVKVQVLCDRCTQPVEDGTTSAVAAVGPGQTVPTYPRRGLEVRVLEGGVWGPTLQMEDLCEACHALVMQRLTDIAGAKAFGQTSVPMVEPSVPEVPAQAPRRLGRPKGSKNKSTPGSVLNSDVQAEPATPVVQTTVFTESPEVSITPSSVVAVPSAPLESSEDSNPDPF